jgi:hypothetical protein
MSSWREEKQRAENSLTELNNKYEEVLPYKELLIELNGKGRLWKTVYERVLIKIEPKIESKHNISEGFRTWREVAIFLSGMRRALKI